MLSSNPIARYLIINISRKNLSKFYVFHGDEKKLLRALILVGYVQTYQSLQDLPEVVLGDMRFTCSLRYKSLVI